jgi:membrane protease YdiL (CAAX protease family)
VAGGTTRAGSAAPAGALRRLPPWAATTLTVAALAAVNVTEHLLPGRWWLGPVEAGALLVFARGCGLTWAQLGLARNRMASGARWGLGAIGLVGAVYLAGVLLPATRSAFQDSRYHVPAPQALMTALVVIPLGTVVLEEVAFRSVLWGMLARHARTWQVLVGTSLLFGLWHVLPSLHLAAANRGVSGAIGSGTLLVVAATALFTAAGGAVFGELRRRSDSVLAAAGAHWATNALGVLFGLLAWSLSAHPGAG